MKIFLDTHIVVNAFVYQQRQAISIIQFISTHHPKPVLSTLTLAILNYYLDKKYKKPDKKKRTVATLLSDLFEISTPALSDIPKMLQHSDWEDAFQYYSAKQCNCNLIITDNYYDYYFSKIKLLSTHEFESMYY